MKMMIALLSLLVSTQLLATEKVPCKSEAHLAVYERYTYEFPDATISLSTKYKPYISGDEAIHVVLVIDLETGEKTMMSAIMDAKTCKVKAVN